MNIVTVTRENVAKEGFFCKMSQKKSPGYLRKQIWLRERFEEGLTLKMLDLRQGGRGFIEYIPGEHAWRPVIADGYMFIHCLWVVGQSKGKGFARLLLSQCEADARRLKRKGVVMVTSQGNWLMSREFLIAHGYVSAGEAPPSFSLLVKRFGNAESPAWPMNWEERAKKFGKGLTIVRADQCPYLDDASLAVEAAGKEAGIKVKTVHMCSAADIRENSPSPYGVFCIVYNGRVISHHYELMKDLPKLFEKVAGP